LSERKCILVVDDEPDIVESTRMTLESAGYDVMTAGNAKEALEQLKKRKPDLIILDVMMARLTEGFDLSHQLRDDPALADIPILIVSGIGEKFGISFSEEESREFVQAEDFLEKPVDPEALLKHVAALLRKGPPPRE